MSLPRNTILVGDCIDSMRTLPDGCVHCCVTSPPYWGLRDYGVDGQLGLETTPEAYIAGMVAVFAEVRRVLRDDGTLWLNIGDSYAGGGATTGGYLSKSTLAGYTGEHTKGRAMARQGEGKVAGRGANRDGCPTPTGLKPKDLVGIPWMLAFALRADGWYLRQEIIWHKPNPMPESCRDRCTKAHESIFLLTKQPRYFYDADAIREDGEGYGRSERFRGSSYTNNNAFDNSAKDVDSTGGGRALCDGSGRNKRSVWTVATAPYSKAHFATYPPKLIEPCILAGTSAKGCCPECGAPWERVTESRRVPTRPGTGSKVYIEPPVHPDSPVRRHNGDVCGNRDPERHISDRTTTGWRPTCTHDADPVPCSILDPFGGSGTTGRVARDLGRNFILCELNPAYAELARERVGGAQPPLFAGGMTG